MSFFNLTLSGKHFISPSILNDSFAGYSNLGCRSLRFILSNVIMMCLGMILFASIFFWTLYASWTCVYISFTKLGKFSFIIFSNKFPISCSFSSPSGTPMMQMLDVLKLSQRLLILSPFYFFFPFAVLIGCFFFLFPNC